MQAIVGWVVWDLCAAVTAMQLMASYRLTGARRQAAFPGGLQGALRSALAVALLVPPWPKLHLLWCFPLAYLPGLFIPMAVLGLRVCGAANGD